MKAKFFSPRFFFGVLVVFAVICLFVVFFGVVRANQRPVSQINVIGTDAVTAVHKAVEGRDIVEGVQYVVDDSNVWSGVCNAMHKQVKNVNEGIHMAAVASNVKDTVVLAHHNPVLNIKTV